MIGNPGVRLLHLVRLRWFLIVGGAVLSAALSLLVGLLSPKTFRSEAVLNIETSKTGISRIMSPLVSEFDETEIALNKAAMLARAPALLGAVAEKLATLSPVELKFAFPERLKYGAFVDRLELLKLRLANLGLVRMTSIKDKHWHNDDIVGQLDNHIQVRVDRPSRSLVLSYDASLPGLARDILHHITAEFINATVRRDREALVSLEAYLQTTVETQLDKMRAIEEKMLAMIEINPELGSEKAVGKGVMASEFLKRVEHLKGLGLELKANEKLISEIKSIETGDKTAESVKREIRNKILDEIAQLEFKLTEYIEVMHYPKTHPSLEPLRDRLQTLKSLLEKKDKESGKAGDSVKDVADLSAQSSDLAKRNRRLKVESEIARKELQDREKSLRSGLRLEFEFGSLVRELDAYTRLIGDLKMDLERTRMQMAGAVPSASVQKQPTLPTIANSLSISKRAAFGLAVGAAMVISLLFMLDLLRPRLLSLDDYASLKIRSGGVIDVIATSISTVVSTLAALGGGERASAGNGEIQPEVLAFFALNPEISLHNWIEDIAVMLSSYGQRTALVVVAGGREAGFRFASRRLGNAEVHALHPEEVPFSYRALLAQLASRSFDKVLVYVEDGAIAEPWQEEILKSSCQIFLLASMGRSEIKDLIRLRDTCEEHRRLCGLVVAA